MFSMILAASAVTFLAICLAYMVGRGEHRPVTTGADESRPVDWQPGLQIVQKYSPPVDVQFAYCNERGAMTDVALRVMEAQARRDGRLYLFGSYRNSEKLSTFRVDRIVCFTDGNGVTVDTSRFLVERLRIPSELYGASAASQAASRHLLAGTARG